MTTLVYDLETDGLLDVVTKVWCMVAQDVDTKEIFSFSDHDPDLPSIADGLKLLQAADVLVAHNGIAFDNSVIKKLYNIDLDKKPFRDTLIMSKILNYMRFNGKHSLKVWGEYLSDNKIEFNDFSEYSKEMLTYCIQDVELNTKVYERLMQEYQRLVAKKPMLKQGMNIEHTMQKINNQMRDEGWNFDLRQAKLTQLDLQDAMTRLERMLEPELGTYKKFIDKEPKQPKFKKDGTYNTHTCNWLTDYFGHEVKPTDTHLMPPGTYFQRTTEVPYQLSKRMTLGDALYSIGFTKHDVAYILGEKVSISVERGEKKGTVTKDQWKEYVDEYYTLRSRLGVLNNWIKNASAAPDGRLRGNMTPIGTPSFRARHSGIVNIPSVSAAWGKEMRELFLPDEGDVLVGADSSGNQLRGLCHYVNNPEYTDIVVNGDQHQRNGDMLGISRKVAKTFLYSYMFGAGDSKLGSVVTGKPDAVAGAKAREDFAKAVVGIEELKTTLEHNWKLREATQGKGWFYGLDGRPVFAPADYQCLNYLLQCAEGITCKAAMVWTHDRIKKEGLRAKFRIMMHDEYQITCHPDDAERVAEIASDAFRVAPKDFGVMCMDGEADIGKSYADTH